MTDANKDKIVSPEKIKMNYAKCLEDIANRYKISLAIVHAKIITEENKLFQRDIKHDINMENYGDRYYLKASQIVDRYYRRQAAKNE